MDLKLIKAKDIKELKNALKDINKQNAELQEEWLNSKETAKFLNVGKRTLQRYRDTGKIAFSKDGRKIRFKKSDIVKYLNKNYFSINDIKKNNNERN